MATLKNKLVLSVVSALSFGSAFACTGISVHYKNHYFVGKNHDWISKYAAIVINPRGMMNQNPSYKHKNPLLNWVSKYGSITVNLVENNKVLPGAMVGMNEQGLSVLVLWQVNAQYTKKPTKPIVPTDLLAKYFLDNAKTVQEAIQLTKKFDVAPSTLSHADIDKIAQTLFIDRNTLGDVNLHLFLQDKKGQTAVFDFLNGTLVILTDKALPILAITNDAYGDSLNYIKKFKVFGGTQPLTGEFDSLARFAKAAYTLQVMPKIDDQSQSISYLFNALTYTQSHTPNTQWTAVFDLSKKTLYLRSIDNQQIRMVRLKKFNLAKGQPIQFLSINNNLSGYVEDKFKRLNTPL